MSKNPPLLSTYMWLRKNRYKKKKRLYELAIGTVIDKTIAVYLGLFAIVGIWIIRDFLMSVPELFSMIEENRLQWMLSIIVIFILQMLLSSFNHPGILFTQAEYQLSLMPFSRKRIWFLGTLEKIIKSVLVGILIVLIGVFLTPLSLKFLLQVTLIGMVTSLLVSFIQWRIFQWIFWKKITLLLSVLGLNVLLQRLIATQLLSFKAAIYLCLFILIGWILIMFKKGMFQGVNWAKVVMLSEVKVWNILLLKIVSGNSVNPPQQYRLFDKIIRGEKAKKPFPYQGSSISFRMWRMYFMEKRDLLYKALGICLFLIVGVGVQGRLGLGISLVIATYIWNQIATSFFVDQFKQPLLYMLPWDISAWIKSFQKWYILSLILFFIPALGLLAWFSVAYYLIPLYIVYFGMIFFLELYVQLYKKITSQLERRDGFIQHYRMYNVLILVLASMSITYPIILVGSPILFLVLLQSKKHLIRKDV